MNSRFVAALWGVHKRSFEIAGKQPVKSSYENVSRLACDTCHSGLEPAYVVYMLILLRKNVDPCYITVVAGNGGTGGFCAFFEYKY